MFIIDYSLKIGIFLCHFFVNFNNLYTRIEFPLDNFASIIKCNGLMPKTDSKYLQFFVFLNAFIE